MVVTKVILMIFCYFGLFFLFILVIITFTPSFNIGEKTLFGNVSESNKDSIDLVVKCHNVQVYAQFVIGLSKPI